MRDALANSAKEKSAIILMYRNSADSSGWPDSNWRPLAPHASALANCATPRGTLRSLGEGGKNRPAKIINNSDSAKYLVF